MFNAISIDKQDGRQSARLADVADSDLPEGAVTVRFEFSTASYKGGLAITGKSPVVRKFPMVPGIDFAGVVESSESNDFRVGDRVSAERMGRRRGPVGRLRAEGTRQSRSKRAISTRAFTGQARCKD